MNRCENRSLYRIIIFFILILNMNAEKKKKFKNNKTCLRESKYRSKHKMYCKFFILSQYLFCFFILQIKMVVELNFGIRKKIYVVDDAVVYNMYRGLLVHLIVK